MTDEPIVTDDDRLRPILERFVAVAREVAAGSASTAALAEVAEKVAVEAQAAALRHGNDGWGTSATINEMVQDRVADLRRAKEWTQDKLATEMHSLGYGWNRLTVTEIERGNRRVTVEEMIGLACLWTVSVVDLVQPAKGVALEVNDVDLPDREVTILLSGAGGPRQVAKSARLVHGLLRAANRTPPDEEDQR